MRIIVLHLERTADRKVHMLAEAKKKKLDLEIFPAIDFKNLTIDEMSKFCDLDAISNQKWLSHGVVCACYSHYLIYKKIVEENIDYALIVEDDIIFDSNINLLLNEIKSHINKNEVILLHYLTTNTLQLSRSNSKELSDSFRLYNSIESAPNVGSAAGYVITRDSALSLQSILLPVRFGTDAWQEFVLREGIHSLRFVYPPPIQTAGFKSYASSGNNKLWNSLTEFIDKYKIPALYHFFRYIRNRNVKSRCKVEVV